MTEFDHDSHPQDSATPIFEDGVEFSLELSPSEKEFGEAKMIYYNEPFPFYFIHRIEVKADSQGKGHGREILKQVNDFLDRQGASGMLIDSILPASKAFGMYEKHGWKTYQKNPQYLLYNWPEEMADSQIRLAIRRGPTD